MSYIATTHECGFGFMSGRSAFTNESTPLTTFSPSISTGITLSVSILASTVSASGSIGWVTSVFMVSAFSGCTGNLASTVMDCSMFSFGFSLVGVRASALGGVRLKNELSTPTAGGRPRGKRRLSDALARFSTRQSGIVELF